MQQQEINVGYRLSPQQRRLWSLQRPGAAYRAQAAFLIEGELESSAIQRALHSTVARHEILRTSFRLIPGMDVPVQVVADSHHDVVETIDLSRLKSSGQKEKVGDYLRQRRERETDFGIEDLLHACLFVLAPQRHVLTLTLPSMCADATSMIVLFKQIVGCHQAAQGGESLHVDAVQYSDFSEWQNDLLEADGEGERLGRESWQEYASARAQLKLPEERTPSVEAPRGPLVFSCSVE
jgi:hypothetical protein